MRVYRNPVAGEWYGSDSGRQFQDHNPADECELRVCFQGAKLEDASHVGRVMTEICPEWKLGPHLKRSEILFHIRSPFTWILEVGSKRAQID